MRGPARRADSEEAIAMLPKPTRRNDLPGNDLGVSLARVSVRLKQLRRQRLLVEKAIIALTDLSRARSRKRRAKRN
jgi:hypothetical protein